MNLFIVESPTKARTIQKYLGKNFVVKATYGHIKDLPVRELGVDEESLRARYVYIRGKRKVVNLLRKLAGSAETVFIGTDPDREGEAIAYFLREEISRVNRNVKRAVFYEITPPALKKSVEEAGDVNMNLVYSQFARRILDRLIGYRISPLLWRTFRKPGLSAGRVQSPALRLIVEREREIENFRERRYYYVKAVFEEKGRRFEAIYDYRYENPSDAKLVAERIKDGVYAVVEVDKRMERIAPPRPFITSSLQSEANARLGFSPEKTQTLAQTLYEQGSITYPRTDSHRINAEKAREFMSYIERIYGRNYVGRIRKFRERPISQGAHECIRPTEPDSKVRGGDTGALYDLIYTRTLASLMADMLVERREVTLEVTAPTLKKPLKMKAKGLRVEFDGWSRVYPAELKETDLPELEKGELLKPLKVYIEERKTQPPPRFTEGSLVKALEKLGIGRPSTYATVVKTLKRRGYVQLRRRSLIPTGIAFPVVDFLLENFPTLMDYEFTARMERILDEVEEGKRNWKEVVRSLLRDIFGETR